MQYIIRRTSARPFPNERNFSDSDLSLIYLHGRGLINIYLHVSDVVHKTFPGGEKCIWRGPLFKLEIGALKIPFFLGFSKSLQSREYNYGPESKR